MQALNYNLSRILGQDECERQKRKLIRNMCAASGMIDLFCIGNPAWQPP